MRIGYARVSTRDQQPGAHHDALHAAGCEWVFIDKVSDKLARRPELDKALLSAVYLFVVPGLAVPVASLIEV